MKIAILIKNQEVNGGNRVAFDLAAALCDLGHQVHLLTDQNTCKNIWHPSQQLVLKIETALPKLYDLAICTYYSELVTLNRINSKAKIRYFQANYMKDGEETLSRISRMIDYITHGPGLPVVVSSYLNKVYRCLDVQPIVISPAIDQELFFRDETYVDNKFRILIEGDIENPWKKVSDAYDITPNEIEIWGLATKDHMRRAKKMWINPDQRDLRKIYSACKVILKLTTKEGFSLTLLEAMKCGCIPIVMNHGGHMDYCISGKNCFVVNHINEVPAAIKRIQEKSKAELGIFQSNCLTTAQQFQWSHVARKFLDLSLRTEVL